jgi:fucose permease
VARAADKTRIVVGTATFFDAFDALTIAYILPAIIPLWHLAPSDIGWLISTGYVSQLIGALPGGWLAERFGRRPVIFTACGSHRVCICLELSIPARAPRPAARRQVEAGLADPARRDRMEPKSPRKHWGVF